ncbi:substrate-binding periplasmic protein [Shimia sagamensis]|uniref:Amino acid ABC transporter substrate-binding protein, PAAT family n=1 Tax=Shimia sagamensis TaxID=1566352 RepID=A0ABY1NLI7_9RHOB|nr:transporter substrate-binding domain-containing protein [Shimia sagamensis]SMP12956.1 amino acid ABC transporter substrate-binding protein, PAAT family [Shimia sagamensis]
MKFLTATVSAIALTISTGAAVADTVTILAADLPPMVYSDGSGREAEIVTQVMQHCGHDVNYVVQPFTRHWATYEGGTGDAVMTVPLGMPMDGAQSAPYIAYQNGVSYLASIGSDFGALDDLAGLSIAAFEGASGILPGLSDAQGSFGSYREMADQETQSKLLFGGRVDGILGDGMLFAAYAASLRDAGSSAGVDASQQLEFRAIFEPSNYAMNFRDPDMSVAFDRCFSELEANGTIAAINTKWIDKYRDTLADNYLSM